MELTPSELDRLLIFNVAQLAQSRRARGVKLNKPEAVALISHAVIESARDGASHSQALQAGINAVTDADLLPGVGPLLSGIAVEAVFSDGRRLVVVDFESKDQDVPGKVTRLEPIASIPNLQFDRVATYGRHLHIPAGEHVDFPPGVEVSVNLVPISGNRILIGFAGLVDGPLDAPGAKENAISKARSLGYLGFES